MADEKQVQPLEDEALEPVAGGFSLAENPCPRCHSSNVKVYYEHDEQVVMRCNDCSNQWVVEWG